MQKFFHTIQFDDFDASFSKGSAVPFCAVRNGHEDGHGACAACELGGRRQFRPPVEDDTLR